MDENKQQIDKLIEKIRIELTAIVAADDGKNETEKSEVTTSKNKVHPTGTIPKTSIKRVNRINTKKEESRGQQASTSSFRNTKDTELTKEMSVISDGKKANFGSSYYASMPMDADLQRMQSELQETYENFQSISNKLENMSFLNLHNSIKDLNLANSDVDVSNKARLREDLKHMLDKNYMKERLESITKEMGKRMQKSEGEFGDIPEVSAFLSSATQLERGLSRLQRQRTEVDELADRVSWATNMSWGRVEEINKVIHNYKLLAEQVFSEQKQT